MASKYKRKTEDEYEVLGDYGQGYELATTETSWVKARERLKEYRANEPGIAFKIVKKRVPITEEAE